MNADTWKRAADRADAVEVLTWHSAARCRPDADTTVLVWLADGEWFAGWWDDEAEAWFDAAHGGRLQDVQRWAEPVGPGAATTLAAPTMAAAPAMKGCICNDDNRIFPT